MGAAVCVWIASGMDDFEEYEFRILTLVQKQFYLDIDVEF